MTRQLASALASLDQDRCLELVQQEIEKGTEVTEIIDECRAGITQVGEKFALGEFYLGELMMAAHVFSECMILLEPLIDATEITKLGVVVLGTVSGDIHDLGKNILCSLLRAEGFDVVDLGVDVPPEQFVKAARETGARIVGLSCLLTVAFDAMRRTVDAFSRAGLRDSVTILIGGSIVSERVCSAVGADDFSTDAVDGVHKCVRIISSLNGTSREEL